MWSDRRMRSYMGVTVHCLSHDMQPETWLLDMSSFTGSHTAEKIGNHCVSLVDDFHVRPKLSYIVTDNAANILKAFKSMSELFPDDRFEGDELTVEDEDKQSEESQDATRDDPVHQAADEITPEDDGEEPLSDETVETILSNSAKNKRLRLSCSIHSLQLVIGDGFKHAKFMTPIMSKASRLANMTHTSGLFSDNFFAVFNNTIPRTNNTRWNSIYIQLEALSKLDTAKLQTFLTEQKL